MQITEAERRHLSQCRTKRCVHSPRATDEKQTNWSKGRHFFFYNLFQIKHESQRKSIDVSLNFGRNTRMNRCRRFKSAEKFKIHFQRQRIH